ncbi:MAG: hypothetical protein KGH59_03935 [Candidatus Micrarchaeota archaeon]|nr:hypothetical protein [Candidatus Micrarchaeota archaeon]MDE1804903.1 hypothetical protein [Candidatus Micrarchaeota archaeon]MDE1846583.1 hypothetical protein [Candidatus Micrarchaeota archaeon]
MDLGERAKDYFAVMDKKLSYKRSSVAIKRRGQEIIVAIEAKDPIALVASLNSVIKQVRIIGNAEQLAEKIG